MIVFVFLIVLANFAYANLPSGLELGFPESWNGDSYKNVSCRVSEIPEWVDGYFLALVNGAYGRSSDPIGLKLTHMLDGLSALASIQFKDGMVRFSGKYIPTKAYKIWDFYARDMKESQVAWSTLRSPHMSASKEKWDLINADYLPYNPNMHIWKMGHKKALAVSENPELGLQFDVASLAEFERPHFHDTNELFTDQSPIKFLSMATHCEPDSDGTVYSTMSGVEPSTNRMYQIVFKINTQGIRTLEGAFEFGRYESSKCGSDLRYMGDKRVLAGLVQSIASTDRYLIIPITSVIVNPCKYQASKRKHRPRKNDFKNWETVSRNRTDQTDEIREFKTAVEFGTDVPVRFLVFHKQKRQFVTTRLMDSYPPRFMTRVVNAYEMDENRLIIDMITYDNYDSYDRAMYVDSVLKESVQDVKTRPIRFTLDIQRGYVERTNLVPDTVQAPMEFPCINQRYLGKRYKYAYVVQPPFTVGGQLGKIHVDDHSASRNLYFSQGPSVVFGHPVFVAKPNSETEDEGVILCMGLETLSKRSVLYVIDASTMRESGRAEMPTVIPFGFHARFFEKHELIDQTRGQSSSTPDPPTETIDSIFSKIYPNLISPWAPVSQEMGDEKASTPIMQRSNTEPSIQVKPWDTVTPKIDIQSSTVSFSQWLTPAVTSASSDSNSGTRAFYLSNGSYIQVFPDGSMKTFPTVPAWTFGQNPPPYLSHQIPPPPVSTTPLQSTVTSGPAVVDPALGSSSAYPRFIFPGLYTTKSTSTTGKPRNSSFIVVDVIVDPNKRTRRPQPFNAADDSDTKSITAVTAKSIRTTSTHEPKIDSTIGHHEDSKSTTHRINGGADDAQKITINGHAHDVHEQKIASLTSDQHKITHPIDTDQKIVHESNDAPSKIDDQTEPIPVANLGKFLERGKGLICKFLAEVISVLGSDFCGQKIKQI